ncbi:MAG: epoxyqueuosine reductase QueH [Acidobacteria bacterium]|jgi:predicted adenine nucleotide alpha hydrolase (AANH) superfamily ATPase|nr:epoxyqueuosine reductase QueH [Acidobacteriota bacterium]
MKEKKKLLLHICCGPCAVYVFEKLKDDYDVTGFFYNPNIQPPQEYEFREKELARVARLKGWHIICEEYDMNNWFRHVKGYEKEPEKGKRCSLCFRLRLEKAFSYARVNNFDIVTSTLSISPYKVTKQINAEGERLAQTFGVEFLPENFKKQGGFDTCRKMAHELEIKHQDYCGCVFSKVEKKLRERKSS